ncbi:SWI5/SAE3 family protein [Aspergillus homomorphus CBS 101889]|uniref:Swi5-domain-containing protein n=1 Tax=Aspergillus homomorphus (strain CBS 101889) TaxID=1450537 RepID=A0A395HRG7_ASPHC|nr:Swi5-domain-containing protein [Aspergillus homomorphus CBS 101889]RAL10079.1 Swi5-domain-containing protein [Aspergillus homomorphus CBS 101889]
MPPPPPSPPPPILASPPGSTAETGKEAASPVDQLAQKEKNKEEPSSLEQSIADLQAQTADLEVQIAEAKAQLKNDPKTTVQRHIRLLHEYNEIKDIGQGLLGLIADARGVRQIDVQREYGVSDQD